MGITMLHPHPESEKGISAYSLNLIENIKKQGVVIKGKPFFQGQPLEVFKWMFKVKPGEIVHVQHEYNMLGWFGLPYFVLLFYLGFVKNNPLVVTMHTALSRKEKFQSGFLKTFLRKILYETQNRLIGWSADKIIVHAEFFKEILVKEYGLNPKKIMILPHAIIENIKIPSRATARKTLGLTGNVYLLIGTMVPDHGHDIVLKQANKIGKTILVATNPDTVNYKNATKIQNFLNLNLEIVKKNNFEKFVRFDLGPITYEKWWKYFAASDLVLLPYRGGIGSGIFADAMIAKKPVVASNVPYFREFAKNYGCVEIAKNDADFPRAIKSAMEKKKFASMVDECRRYYKENGLTPISKKYKKMYSSLE